MDFLSNMGMPGEKGHKCFDEIERDGIGWDT